MHVGFAEFPIERRARKPQEPAMSANANILRNSGIFARYEIAKPTVVHPTTFRDLQDYLDPSSNYLAPYRPMGAGSSSTDCSTATAGTVIDMTGMDQIIKINAYNHASSSFGDHSGNLADKPHSDNCHHLSKLDICSP